MVRIVDAEGAIAGRLGARVAKMLLKGEEVVVINAEKALISGDKDYTVQHYREKILRGDPYHGPFYPKRPDRILRRIIRGMLPIKKDKVRRAYRRLKVYISVPEELKDKINKEEIIKMEVKRLRKAITLGELSRIVAGYVANSR